MLSQSYKSINYIGSNREKKWFFNLNTKKTIQNFGCTNNIVCWLKYRFLPPAYKLTPKINQIVWGLFMTHICLLALTLNLLHSCYSLADLSKNRYLISTSQNYQLFFTNLNCTKISVRNFLKCKFWWLVNFGWIILGNFFIFSPIFLA